MISIKKIYSLFKKSSGINTDSRVKQKNALFFALSGENFDGNEFVENAIENGCLAAICSNKRLANNENIFYVENTLNTLQKLANYHRKQLKTPIIAITGTNGKTTTKELISTILAQTHRVAYTSGNKNNHIGVPLTILSMNRTVDIGIVEMGANHQGEIKTLCEIAEPNYGIITNVGKAHLEGFGSFEIIKQTKAELYDYLKLKNGEIFINADNPLLVEMLGNYSAIKYGIDSNYYCSGKYSELSLQATVSWKSKNEKGIAKSNLIGAYNFENILAAITIGQYFKVPGTAIDNAILRYYPNNNRSQLVKTNRNNLILDYYNANPTSMELAIKNFENIKDNSKGLILGDMLELGKDSEIEHKKILEYISNKSFKKVYLIGPHFYKFKEEYGFNFFNSVDDFAKHIVKKPETGNFFLIKGSRGVKLEKCTDYL